MAWQTTNFILSCDTSGVEHAVEVSTPIRYEALDAAPLIVCLDGAWTAGTVRDATRIMSMSGEAPEAVVASVSFTDDKMSDYVRSRACWFSPTAWVPPEVTGVKGVVAEELGRASTYLALIRDQLLPRLAADFRVSERWLVGHSFSGLFGLSVLFDQPELFDKYLLASPSIWWDDRVILDIEADYAANHQDLAAQVFLSAGALEADLGSQFNMFGNVDELASTLRGRAWPNLTLSHAALPNESHSSTIGAAISQGLRTLN